MIGRSAAAAGDGEGGEGVSKRDYYEVLERRADGDRRRNQERLPQAGDEVPPGPQSGRPARRKRNSRKRPKPTRCSPTPRSAALYDRFGHAGVRSAAGAGAGFDPSVFQEFGDFADILGNMFGFGDMFGGGRRRGGPQRGADLRYDLEISFEESARGAETTIQIPRQETCETCHGIGRGAGLDAHHLPAVPRPGPGPLSAGILHRRAHLSAVPRRRQDHQQAVPRPAAAPDGCRSDERSPSRFPPASPPGSSCGCRAKAKSGSAGGPAGHLYVVVHVQEHEFFRRDGINLFCEIPVNFTTVALGGDIQVPTLDGQETVKVPEGTQTGTTLRLRGKGMPDVDGRGRGDLFATVQVKTPKKLTREQRQIARAARRRAAEREIRAAPAPGRGCDRRAESVRPRQGHVRIAEQVSQEFASWSIREFASW